jgi:hypothetical protein
LESSVVSRRSSSERRPKTDSRRLLLAVLLFAAWSNLHGGFLFGLVLIGFYIVGDGIQLALGRGRPELRSVLLRRAALFGAAVVGSCINPVGPRILSHVMGYLGKTWLVDMTLEYRSPDFPGAYGRELLVALALAILALALVRRRMAWPQLVAFLGTTAFALHSMRNIPLWGLTALPLVAVHADQAWRSAAYRPLASVRSAFATGSDLARAGIWTGVSATALVLLAAGGGKVGMAQLLPDHFDSSVFPVRLVERARAHHVSGRIFNELTWGGYILNAWPEQRVFIDGQTDFYGESLSKDYAQLRAAAPGWSEMLDSLGVDMVLIPADAPLARALAQATNWEIADSADAARRLTRRYRPAAPSPGLRSRQEQERFHPSPYLQASPRRSGSPSAHSAT